MANVGEVLDRWSCVCEFQMKHLAQMGPVATILDECGADTFRAVCEIGALPFDNLDIVVRARELRQRLGPRRGDGAEWRAAVERFRAEYKFIAPRRRKWVSPEEEVRRYNEAARRLGRG